MTILPRGNWTPLMYAAREGAVEATRASAPGPGADVNLTDQADPRRSFAIVSVHYDVAGVLLEHGADPYLADTSNMAALSRFAGDGNDLARSTTGRRADSADKLDGLALVKSCSRALAQANAQLGHPRSRTTRPGRDARQRRDTADARLKGAAATQCKRCSAGRPTVQQRQWRDGSDDSPLVSDGWWRLRRTSAQRDDMFRSAKLCLDRWVDPNVTNACRPDGAPFAVRTVTPGESSSPTEGRRSTSGSAGTRRSTTPGASASADVPAAPPPIGPAPSIFYPNYWRTRENLSPNLPKSIDPL